MVPNIQLCFMIRTDTSLFCSPFIMDYFSNYVQLIFINRNVRLCVINNVF